MDLHPPAADRRGQQLEKLREAARRLGGRCISEEYVSYAVKVEFECRQGHRWHTRPTSIGEGKWCPECSRRPPIRLLAVQVIARARGGSCLSATYIPVLPGMRWRCAEGHEWSALPERITRGVWCPMCTGRRTIEGMQALAARHGGRCLSTSMAEAANDACMQWECARGHRLEIRPRCVRDGQWCPECRKIDVGWRKVLERCQALAAHNGGRCLTVDKPEEMRDPCLLWECAEGHQFEVRRRCVSVGQWCPTCRKADGSWQTALALARAAGGVCLAEDDPPTQKSVQWRCAQGHVFSNNAYTIAQGHWCSRCAGTKLSIEIMQKMAEKRHGRCVSRKFVDARTKLQWECEQGHRFWAQPLGVRHRDSWCPECKPKPKIADAWGVAIERARELGGVCLAAARSNLTVDWRCAKGHEWRATPYKIAAGLWCSNCSARRLTIEHMQKMAAERDGHCISKKYEGCHTKLQWECEKGHRWWARPTILRQTGCWCPDCAWDRNAERMRSEAKDRR